MKTFLKIGSEAIILFTFLYGLVTTKIIGLDIAITIGIIVGVFLLCFEKLNILFHPLINACAEIQKWLKENFNFIPLHPIESTGYKYVKESSPINLTDLGKDLLKKVVVRKSLIINIQN